MIAIIQCAATKRPDAGHLQRQDGTKCMFVADPASAPTDSERIHAHPDEASDTGESWREKLVRYNADPGSNPCGLLRAFELYENASRRGLVDRLGTDRVYILSAGRGLISASFLTPAYDITLNTRAKQKAPWKFRKKEDSYADLCHLPADTVEPVIFFGGKDYMPLFCKLTGSIPSRRTIFYNSSRPPDAPGCVLHRFSTTAKTNWHYQCVKAFLQGQIDVRA